MTLQQLACLFPLLVDWTGLAWLQPV